MIGFDLSPLLALFFGSVFVFLLLGRAGLRKTVKWQRWLFLGPITLASVFFLLILLRAFVALVTSQMDLMGFWVACIFSGLPLFVIYNLVFIHLKPKAGGNHA